MKLDDIEVLVLCSAYNHENYIEDALKGFVSQKTTFPFAVVVHDDASLDGTAAIIRKYETEYPEIIRPIFESENQYSQNIDWKRPIIEASSACYLAICEGDDYWTDCNKLQSQYEYMKDHPECALSVHAAKYYNDRRGIFIKSPLASTVERDFRLAEVILGDGEMFATCSMFFPVSFCKNMPAEYSNWGVGDYPLCIYLASKGSVHFSPVFMSVYRVNAKGSWTERMENSVEDCVKSYKNIQNGLDSLIPLVNEEAKQALIYMIKKYELNIAVKQRDWEAVQSGSCKEVFDSFSAKAKAQIVCRVKFPRIWRLYLHLRQRD